MALSWGTQNLSSESNKLLFITKKLKNKQSKIKMTGGFS
jgi:hypothetical protein